MSKSYCEVRLESHIKELNEATLKALETAMKLCGEAGEGYAKILCPTKSGNLKNSITHQEEVNENNIQTEIGTVVEYAPYVECGTGVYAENSSAKKIPWAYQDEKGNWHRTSGQKPQPYLKPALSEHVKDYQQIIIDTLKNNLEKGAH